MIWNDIFYNMRYNIKNNRIYNLIMSKKYLIWNDMWFNIIHYNTIIQQNKT
jgi:hypothetical protein